MSFNSPVTQRRRAMVLRLEESLEESAPPLHAYRSSSYRSSSARSSSLEVDMAGLVLSGSWGQTYGRSASSSSTETESQEVRENHQLEKI